MHESTGSCRGLSVSLGLCVHAVLVQHFMAINVAQSSNNSDWKGIP